MSRAVVHASPRGVLFVERWEGLRLKPYNDSGDNATVGVGHLLHLGPVTPADVAHWRGLTRERALGILTHDLVRAEAPLLQFVVPPLVAQHRFDALVSFIFNIGAGAFEGSHLRQLLNSGRRGIAAADELLRWTHAGGVEVPGLVRRRLAERALYLHGDYETSRGGWPPPRGTCDTPPPRGTW